MNGEQRAGKETDSNEAIQVETTRLQQRIAELEHIVADMTIELTHTRTAIQHAVQTEEALRTSEERFRTLIEHNTDAIMVIRERMVRFVNPSAERLFNRSAHELMEQELGLPIAGRDKVEVDILDKSGNQLVAEMQVDEIVWESQSAYLATFRDITERKQLEKELERRVKERTAMLQHTLQQLSAELAEREKTEKAILRRDAILEAIEFAAHRFLKGTTIDQEIPMVLEYMGKATLVSRVTLFALANETTIQAMYHVLLPKNNDDSDDTSNTTETSLSDQPPDQTASPAGARNFSRWREQLRRGFSIYGDTRTLPPSERTILEQEKISSLVVIPVFVEHQWWGFIEFDEHQSGRTWLLAELEALRAAASMIGTALQHGRLLHALQESEERFRTIADFAYGWEYWIGPDGNYLYVSPSCQRITGYPPQAFQTNPALLEHICHPDDRELVRKHLQDVNTPCQEKNTHFRIITQDGAVRWIEHVCQPVYDRNGQWLGRRGSNRDTTDQVILEQALKREQQLFVSGPVVMFKWHDSGDWSVEYVSPNVAQFGYTAHDFINGNLPYTQFIHPHDVQRVTDELRICSEAGDTWLEQDYRVVRADSTTRWVYAYTRLSRNEWGDVTDYDGYILDITDRKQTEEALRQSEEQFRAFVEGTDDLVIQMDGSGRLTYINDVAERVFGLANADSQEQQLFDFIHQDDRQRIQAAFKGWLQNRSTGVTFECRLLHRNRNVLYMHWAINMRYQPDGSVMEINGIGRDFTERKRVEETLRERETRYRTISELVSDFAYGLRVEPDGKLVLDWVTDAFARITGFTMEQVEAQGGWYSLVYPDDLNMVQQSYEWLLSGQQSDVYEFRILTRRGNIRWLRNHSRPMWDKALGRVSRIYGGMQDMTEWKQAMEAMQESEQVFHRFVAVEQDGLLLLNNHGYVVEWNAAAERIWSQSKMDVLGLPLWDVMFERTVGEHKNDAGYEHLKAMTQDWMQNQQTIQDENWVQLEIEHSDGTRQLVRMLLFPIQTSKGKLFGGIVKAE